jgi:Lon protease-like protein
MAASAEIALFPLNSVLFPGGPLPLRIFETRYTDMVRRCMREDAGFGVVLIRAGAEVGEVASTAEVGTLARIVDFYPLPDRLLGITCRGERRFRVLRRWRDGSGLNMAEVSWLEVPPPVAVPEEFHHLAELIRKVLPELGELYEGIEPRLDDADWVGCRLVEILPISLGDKQACLELDDPVARLARLAPLIRRVDD